jgi:hypothetical protein
VLHIAHGRLGISLVGEGICVAFTDVLQKTDEDLNVSVVLYPLKRNELLQFAVTLLTQADDDSVVRLAVMTARKDVVAG